MILQLHSGEGAPELVKSRLADYSKKYPMMRLWRLEQENDQRRVAG